MALPGGGAYYMTHNPEASCATDRPKSFRLPRGTGARPEPLGLDARWQLGRVCQMSRAPSRKHDFLSLDRLDNSLSISVG